MIKKCEGLRERKRQETRQALETAALELVQRYGLENMTIEAISEKANVSPRTFFNYFTSKEDVLLGFYSIELTNDNVDEHLSKVRHDSITTTTVGLMIQLIAPTLTDRNLYKTRRQLIKQYPRLLERQMDYRTHISERFIEIIQRVIATQHKIELSNSQAEVLLGYCSSGVRIAIREWAASDKKLSLEYLENQALQTLNEVQNKL